MSWKEKAVGYGGIIISAALIVMSLLILRDRDVDPADVRFKKPKSNPGYHAVVGVASLITAQWLFYCFATFLQYGKEQGGRSFEKLFNSGVQVQLTVGTILTTALAILVWIQSQADGMAMIGDLMIITFLLQSGAMVSNWQVATT